jgi:hypothetical protein
MEDNHAALDRLRKRDRHCAHKGRWGTRGSREGST